MTFLTSVLLGLSMGSGAVFSIRYGEGDQEGLKAGIFHSFLLIGRCGGSDEFHCLPFYRSHYGPSSGSFRCISPYERVSLDHICRDPGCFSVQLFCLLLRAVGNSVTPLIFLAVSALLNIGLDLLFVVGFQWSVAGAAFATVLSQYVSGAGILI